MRQLCPRCNILSSENALACDRCGTSFMPALQAQPPESSESGKDMVPAPQPDEFVVNRSGNELTITWGMGILHKVSAVGFVALSLALFGLSITTATDTDDLMFTGLILLGAIYWLIAMCANRTSLRLSDDEWVISKGPVPLPIPDFYYSSERRIDPRTYEVVVAVKGPDKKHSWGRMRNLADILFELVFWLMHQGTKESRVTHTLYGRTRSGTRDALVTGLKEGQANYLARKLQDLLEAGVQPAEATSATAQDMAVQPASADHVREPLAEAAEDGVATDMDGTEKAEPFVSCLSCRAANPADSAFCGECGAVLEFAHR